MSSGLRKRLDAAEEAALREEQKRLETELGNLDKERLATKEELRKLLLHRSCLLRTLDTGASSDTRWLLETIAASVKSMRELVQEAEDGIEAFRSQIKDIDLQLEALHPTYIETVLSEGSPSTVEKEGLSKVQTRGDEPLYECYFPANAQPPFPLTLAHPVFAQFQDDFSDTSIMLDDGVCEFVADLCVNVLGRFTEERALRQAFNTKLSGFLGFMVTTDEAQCGKTTASTDATVAAVFANLRQWLGLGELKVHRGDTLAQGLQTFAIYVGSKNEQPQLFPCFYFEVVGFMIRIGALVFYEKVAWEPLTPFMNCLYSDYDKGNLVTVCRAMLALRKGLVALKSYYRESAGVSSNTITFQDVPYPLQGKQNVSRIGKKLVFVVTLDDGERRLFKYCRQYGEEVHRSWADKGLAPLLYACKSIAGGWLEVQMQYLEAWSPAFSLLDGMTETEKDRLKAAISAALDRGLAIHLDHSPVAHGDMRLPNIMVRREDGGDKFDIKFVDFDWAGKVGVTRYPPFINKALKWHQDVGAGKTLEQDHDKWLLTML